jgi:hypothetical protein
LRTLNQECFASDGYGSSAETDARGVGGKASRYKGYVIKNIQPKSVLIINSNLIAKVDDTVAQK